MILEDLHVVPRRGRRPDERSRGTSTPVPVSVPAGGEAESESPDRKVADLRRALKEAVKESKEAMSAAPERSDAVRALRYRRIAAVLLALTIAGGAGTAVFAHAWSRDNAVLSEQKSVRTVASNFLVALTNFDPQTIDKDFARLQGYATGNFASQANQFFNSQIRQQLETALAASRGQIRTIDVQSVSGSSASVYAVIDQTFVNDKISTPQADVLRLVVDMQRKSGAWRISDVTVLQAPSSSAGS